MKTNAWFLFERSQQLPDTWVAHCLDLDVVTYGSSLDDALRMGIEAAQMALSDDLAAGLDSRRRRAPEEDWRRLYDLMANATKRIPVEMLGQRQSELRIVAANLELSVSSPMSFDKTSSEEPIGAILAA
jgi:hypothetical protein